MSARRQDFPLLAATPGLHYLDSAATSQKPRVVLDAMRDYYERDNANPHRGAYDLSARATERYHAARERVARFVGVADADCLIFTRGTTEALNLVATAWGPANVGPGDEIVVTGLEHHANFVPWQQLALARGARFVVCPLTADHHVDLDAMRRLVGPRTRLVAFSHVSNALGTMNDVRTLAEIAHGVGALAVCDGAQAVPHLRVGFDGLGVDFYAFSGHKMCGPMGIGGLIGRRATLEAMSPYQFGGDMIEFVRDDHSTWNVLPHKFEAGTPNVGDAVGLAAACDYLDAIGMDAVLAHEQGLVRLATERLAGIEGLRVYGPPANQRSGVVSFTVSDIHPHDLATVLDQDGVCIRAGHHCAQPLMRRLGVSATARASFYVYSDEGDVDALVRSIERAKVLFGPAAVG
ncbi:MAG: cysteine desulfurase [Gemmatimonadaceae bacterium]|nr:cysteine desulfurase [Gemmatimonadaceae bacterium]NUO93478.1 cysteine desulfurase [Gemmatimonadaceae bacterium]NUP70780.1 cysteine desulfurase [Gemmatimonadaceae bacterium]NUR35769.1 cysteine desulfurase [Gemmatimonadaceae bacterium]NUS32277.1 cysteine desulfurase [Gemmatimonadaceae bacterium]